MGDVLRAEEIETCKENIQPLREGRRASTLKKIMTNTKSVEDIEKERQYVPMLRCNAIHEKDSKHRFDPM